MGLPFFVVADELIELFPWVRVYCWEEREEEVGGGQPDAVDSESPGSHGVTWKGGYTPIPTLTCDETCL